MKKTVSLVLMFLFVAFSLQLNAQVDKNRKTEASIASKKSGNISKSAIISAGKIDISTASKTIASFDMTFKSGSGVQTLTSNSKNFTTEMKNAINGFKLSTPVTFQNIMIYENSTPDRKERIEPITLIIE